MLCECGCGETTALAPRNNSRKGWTCGQPLRFVRWHHLKLNVPQESTINYPVKSLPDGRVVKKHRQRAEIALGKSLPVGVHVHHVDGSKNPRAPLVICQDAAYHQLLHVRTRVLRAGGNPNTDKICARCKAVKSKSDFGSSTFTNSGLRQSCRACDRKYKNAWANR